MKTLSMWDFWILHHHSSLAEPWYVLWLFGIRSPSPQSIAYVHSHNKTKHPDKAWDFPLWGALAESWEAQKDPLFRLGGCNPSVPVSRDVLAMLPCTTWAGWWDFVESASSGVPHRKGLFPAPWCRSISLFYMCTKLEKKKVQFQDSNQDENSGWGACGAGCC